MPTQHTPPQRPNKQRRSLLWRTLGLGLFGVCLYVFAPTLLSTFASVTELQRINPLWFPVVIGFQAASFSCIWFLLSIALRTRRWFTIATSQLASNAFSRVVPGGAAAGMALQYRMLSRAGISTTNAASGLAAVSLLTMAVVLAFPLFAIPAIISGSAASGLVRAALFGGFVFVGVSSSGAVLLFNDRAVLRLGTAIQRALAIFRLNDKNADLPHRLVEERNALRDALRSQWRQALAAAGGRSLLDYASLLAALWAVGAQPSPALVVLAFVAAQVLATIPLTPGGLGFVEAGLTAMLTLAGVPPPLAVVATLLYRLACYWLPMLAGLVAFGMFQRRYPKRLR